MRRLSTKIHSLVDALKEKVAGELLAASDGVPQELLIARLTQRLVHVRGLDQELARWAVVTWGIALGRLAPDAFGVNDGDEQSLKDPPKPELDRESIEAKRQKAALEQLDAERRRQEDEARRNEELRRKLDKDSKRDVPKPWLNWKIAGAIGAALVVLLWFLLVPKPLEVQSVRFFGAEDGLSAQITNPTISRPNYKTEFSSNEARFIWYDLSLVKAASKDVTVDVLWRYPDGVTFTQNVGIKNGSYGYTLGRGFRQGLPNWRVGRYVVEFSTNGKKIATGEFSITPARFRSVPSFPLPGPIPPSPGPVPSQSPFDIPSLQSNLVGGLRFFEGPKQAPQPQSRFYQSRFDARSARYIRAEVHLKNAGQLPPRDFKITTVWFKEGVEFYRGDYVYASPRPQESRLYSLYYGGDAPGIWQRGNYRTQVTSARNSSNRGHSSSSSSWRSRLHLPVRE